MGRKRQFNTANEMQDFLEAMETAIRTMVQEIQKPVDPDISGSARKAELQSIKQTAQDCRDMFRMRMEVENMLNEIRQGGDIEDSRDFSAGFAEQFSK
jgi:queuine/archaeosine tRNA-ribosyltransferase